MNCLLASQARDEKRHDGPRSSTLTTSSEGDPLAEPKKKSRIVTARMGRNQKGLTAEAEEEACSAHSGRRERSVLLHSWSNAGTNGVEREQRRHGACARVQRE